MTYWNWGVNFDESETSHYKMMLDEGIVIGSENTDYRIGDIVAVHKGQGLLAIARVTSNQIPLTAHPRYVEYVQRYGFTENLSPGYSTAVFVKVFPVQRGAGRINDPIRQRLIQTALDVLSLETVEAA